MILLFVSVWMRPSRGLQRPRTVIVCGRSVKIEIEFFLEDVAEFVARQFVEEGLGTPGPKDS